MSTTNNQRALALAPMFGIAGWAAENVFFGPRFSGAFGKHHVPFLPVYALGSLAMLAIAPKISRWSPLARAAVYATTGGVVEFLGAQVDRELLKKRSWNYEANDALSRATEGAVDWSHAALWGGLGLLGEKILPAGKGR